ncbi:IPT/TIG domain-containing protein [Ruminococcaceae bacterium OttesenSCG-928-A11]|nr:IPT/TIG domain-containing protein [Ruminococcaceae bacterium OttesenSCG-928-A11]
MKSTTFQQKMIFSAKIFACMLILGILSWLSFMPTKKTQVASAASGDVVLSVTVAYTAPSIDATAPPEVGKEVPIGGTSNNVDSVDVFLDVNGNGVYDPGTDTQLVGNVTVGAGGILTGSVSLPDDLNYGEHDLIVRGHTANTSGGYDEYVYDTVTVDYTADSPIVNCVHNTDNDCSILPGGDKPAFGGIEGGTEIIIDGDNFGDASDTTVTIGDQECVIVSVESNKITCIVPPAKDGQPGAQDVTVCVKGLCSSIEDGFLYSILPIPPETGGDVTAPGTGLFRVGNTVVTVKDIVWWIGLIVIIAVMVALIIIVKSPKKTTHYSAGSGSNKKRNYRSQKVAFTSTKKNTKSKTRKN